MAASFGDYSKVIFELPGDTPPRELVMPVEAAWHAARRDDIVAVMGEALAAPLDVADRAAVAEHGVDGAVTRLLDMAGIDFQWAAEEEGTIYHLASGLPIGAEALVDSCWRGLGSHQAAEWA